MRKRKTPPRESPAKKPISEFKKRACAKNLEKAREANRKKQHEKEMVKVDERLKDLSDDIDDAVDKQVANRLKKFDRKKLKDEVLQVFYDMGGTRAMKKWAKDNKGAYYKLMAAILKVDNDKEGAGRGGVTVNIFDPKASDKIIDITPDK